MSKQSTVKGRALTVEISHDPDVGNPCDEEGAWKLYSFSNRHLRYRDPNDFFFIPGWEPTPMLRDDLEEGTAWVLSYFEHGLCEWMLHDEPKGRFGGDWRWDGVPVAGVLVWENPEEDLGPHTKEDRRADAASFVEAYTQWCNGETYAYTIYDADGDEVGKDGWIIGTDELIDSVLERLEDGDEVVEVRDQIAGLTKENFRR